MGGFRGSPPENKVEYLEIRRGKQSKLVAFAVDFSVFSRAWQAFHYWVACDPSTY